MKRVFIQCISILTVLFPLYSVNGQSYETNKVQGANTMEISSAYINPGSSVNLDIKVNETSGLFFWNDTLWTHNDNSDVTFYAIDRETGAIINTIALNIPTASDWEASCQDADFLYLGDFGNNGTGSRSNLRIFKISKASIYASQAEIDTIAFSYPDQVDFSASSDTDFDCEAFIVIEDSLYLFTKQWKSKGTTVYALPTVKGEYILNPVDSFAVNALVTDACYFEAYNNIVLTMYSESLQPYFVVLNNYKNNRFFQGSVNTLNVALQFHQVEGITTSDGFNYYVSNEKFTYSVLTTPAKLHSFDLSEYIETMDSDGDGIGDIADTDDDNDGYTDSDEEDNATDPFNEDSVPDDYDNDSISDLNDPDDDNDGVNNDEDAYPLDSLKWTGIGQMKNIPCTIFANPAQNSIQIDSPEAIILSTIIYDLNGRLLLDKRNINSTNCIVDIAGFQQGVYEVIVETAIGKYRDTIVKK